MARWIGHPAVGIVLETWLSFTGETTDEGARVLHTLGDKSESRTTKDIIKL